jgi:ABC-type Fe3+-hydroxamate transport system substrate-binding protein
VTSAPRIVSLVPSITELLVDLGLGAFLVGRTGFCIHPADAVKHIPKVGGTKDVNLAKIKRLMPTHVIVNIDENELPLVSALREWVPQVIVTHPQTPQDNLALIDQLLQMTEIFAIDFIAKNSILASGRALKSNILLGTERLHTKRNAPQRVLYLIWRDPWMTVARDTYISHMLDLIGWQTWPDALGGETGAARYPIVRGDEPWLGTVQRVLLSSEPYRFGAQHLQEVQNWLPHVHVQLVDGEMLSWYGSRAVKGLAYLAELADLAGAAPLASVASSPV